MRLFQEVLEEDLHVTALLPVTERWLWVGTYGGVVLVYEVLEQQGRPPPLLTPPRSGGWEGGRRGKRGNTGG